MKGKEMWVIYQKSCRWGKFPPLIITNKKVETMMMMMAIMMRIILYIRNTKNDN